MRIAVVAPACRLDHETAERVQTLAAQRFGDAVSLTFDPQCFLSAGHFAGDDDARAAALIRVANDPAFDAVWFARGGYGSARLLERVMPALGSAALAKTWVGYSDTGALLAALYAAAATRVAHGPMPADIRREGGEHAVARALDFIVRTEPAAIEPTCRSMPSAAFNLTILAHLMGTPWAPDLSGHVLMLEEVSEHHYRIDRALCQVFSVAAMRRLAGVRLGRCSLIPPNDPDFGQSEEEIVRHWCAVAGVPYLGRADIGHDVDNKVAPFGDGWRR